MSYPDPAQQPNSFVSPPYSGGDAATFWPSSFWLGSEQQQQQQQQQQPDLMQQFDRLHQSKKPRTGDRPPSFAPIPPMNQPMNQPMNPRINQSNVPGNKGTSHIFYKTRICAKFMEGTCRNGDSCTFAHGAEDLREPPPNWQDMIREKERSNGGGGGYAEDQRMILRMKICKKYFNGEECPYGDKCNFLHNRSMRNPKVEMPGQGQRESAAISIGVTGDSRGNAGDQDQMALGLKTRLCHRWEMGNCNYGDKCHFTHGHSDLKYPGAFEGESAVITNANANAVLGPRKFPPVSAFPTPPAAVATPAAVEDTEEKRIAKWKLRSKVNRIYADWPDDLTPPDCLQSNERV